MKRRLFLKSASALPFAFTSVPFGLLAEHDSAEPANVVAAGQDRLQETHSLGYSRICFKVLPRETNDGLFVIEHMNLGKNGPPVHRHAGQDEWFYVMDGAVLFQIGDERKRLTPGDSILGPRGIPHAFRGDSAQPAHMLIAFTPAGKMEGFFREAAVQNPPKLDAAFHERFGIELVGPPLS